MKKPKKQPKSADENLADLRRLLSHFEREIANPELRVKVNRLIPSFSALRKLGVSLMQDNSAVGARNRILAYFKKYPKTVIAGDELMVISGIGEWARRVRELRVQFGWVIYTGTTFRDMVKDDDSSEATMNSDALKSMLGRDPLSLKPTEYVLLSERQDRDAAHRWNLLNEIRKKDISVKAKMLEYFRHNVGQEISGEELKYLAKDRNEWPRRVRELRTEEGWPVATKMSGRPDLAVGVYMLERDEQAQEHDRRIPDPIRVKVLERDQYQCQICSWDRSMAQPGEPRRFLELHHIVHHGDKGTNEATNLVTLCNVHHDEVHRDKEANERVAQLKL